MHPVLFDLGGMVIRAYPVAMGLAFLIPTLLAARRVKKIGRDPWDIYSLVWWLYLATLVGGRSLFVVTRWNHLENPWLELLIFWRGGMVFYGGFLLSTLAAFIFFLARRLPPFLYADLITPYIALGYAIHRSLGCFLNGCCYGGPSTLPWAMIYPPGSYPDQAYGQVPLHPSPLYEALAGLVIMVILLWRRDRSKVPGSAVALLLGLYSISRFLIEMTRGDSIRGFVGALSTSQAISFGVLILAVTLYAVARRIARRTELPPSPLPGSE